MFLKGMLHSLVHELPKRQGAGRFLPAASLAADMLCDSSLGLKSSFLVLRPKGTMAQVPSVET